MPQRISLDAADVRQWAEANPAEFDKLVVQLASASSIRMWYDRHNPINTRLGTQAKVEAGAQAVVQSAPGTFRLA